MEALNRLREELLNELKEEIKKANEERAKEEAEKSDKNEDGQETKLIIETTEEYVKVEGFGNDFLVMETIVALASYLEEKVGLTPEELGTAIRIHRLAKGLEI